MRGANHMPGQSIGLGNAVVVTPSKATLLDGTKGLSWWNGMCSTYFSYHPDAKIGVMLYGAHLHSEGGKRKVGGWRDAINAAYHLSGKA